MSVWAEYAPTVTALFGTVLGLLVGRRMRPRPPKPIKPQPPVCTCRHGFGTHEGGKACAAEIQRPDKWNKDGDERGWTYVRCPCTNYDGPDPLMWRA